MNRLNDLDYLRLNRFQAFFYNLKLFFCGIPGWLWGLLCGIGRFFKNCGIGIKDEVLDIGRTFKRGNWAVKLSFFVFGAGNLFYGQIMRGLFFLLFELIFLGYMFMPGGGAYWIGKAQLFQTGATVGTAQGGWQWVDQYGEKMEIWVTGDDSVKVLFYALLSIIFIFAFLYTWRLQVKQCRINMDIVAKGKKVRSGKQDLKSLLDDQFHKTLLALPTLGIALFTVLPIIFMILIAFTNYDNNHDGWANLFSWVGLNNFNEIVNFGKGGLALTFGEILSWTLIWSFFATFTNYFLGMFVAMMINKRGIRLKKFWRTVLVMTIAIPQFVSLLYVSRLFDDSGVIGKLLIDWGFLKWGVSLWDNPLSAKILLIVINIWIGIPYLMLMVTGVLMNIPQDLYESSRIDGANTFQQYTKITLPYVLFVTGPYLLTSFVANLNNFNVIYLLSNGNPIKGTAGGASVGHTDLLITWLFKITLEGQNKFYMASVVGILVFLVVAILSLVVYNVIPSTRNEEDYK